MTKNDLKEKIKNLILGYNHFIPSFSQAGEDRILSNIFKKVSDGFYVDIGAYHPLSGSNTHYFYRFKNWRGINIEPNPDQFRYFEKLRNKDINLNFGISAHSEVLNYYVVKNIPVMNSFSLDFIKENGLENHISKVLEIQTHPLSYVLDTYLPENKEIDIMNIDVEGLDMQVLESNNWEKYKPKAIIIETGLKDWEDNQIRNYLYQKGYILVGLTPVNTQINMSCIYYDKILFEALSNY